MGGPLRAVLTQDDGVVVSLCREPSYSIAPTSGTTRTPARQHRFLRSLTTQQIGNINPSTPADTTADLVDSEPRQVATSRLDEADGLAGIPETRFHFNRAPDKSCLYDLAGCQDSKC